MKEFKIAISDMSIDKRVTTITELSNEGWKVVGFTDHQTLFEREIVEEQLITEG